MKTMCPPGYHHNGSVATHALGNMIYGFTSCAQVHYTLLYVNDCDLLECSTYTEIKSQLYIVNI